MFYKKLECQKQRRERNQYGSVGSQQRKEQLKLVKSVNKTAKKLNSQKMYSCLFCSLKLVLEYLTHNLLPLIFQNILNNLFGQSFLLLVVMLP